MLSGGFAESLVSDIDAINADYASQRTSLAEYGYESDSDLEDDDDDDDGDGDVHESESGQRLDGQHEGNDSNTECAEAVGLEGTSASTAAYLPGRPIGTHMQRPGRTVFVKDVAYKT